MAVSGQLKRSYTTEVVDSPNGQEVFRLKNKHTGYQQPLAYLYYGEMNIHKIINADNMLTSLHLATWRDETNVSSYEKEKERDSTSAI